MLRANSVAGIETATALILEREHRWTRAEIGMTISLVFLAIIPLKMAYNAFETKLSFATWVWLLLGASLVGSMLFFPPPIWLLQLLGLEGWYSTHAYVLLLLGDAIIFPSFFLTDGLCQGFALQNLPPDGQSIVDVNSVTLLSIIAIGIGRFIGPPLARYQVGHGGQSMYARQQFIAIVVASVLGVYALIVNATPHE